MIKTKINAIKKESTRIHNKYGESTPYYNCLGVIRALEKLDNGEELDKFDIAYINYPYYLFEGNIKMIGEWYYDYYCR